MMGPRFVVNHRRAGDIERLPEAVRRVARLCDGMRTLDELAALSRLPADRAGQVVDRLVNLGIVFEVTEPPLKSRRRRVTPVAVQQWLATAAIAATEAPQAMASPATMAPPETMAPPATMAPPPLEPPPLEAPRPSVTLPPPPAAPVDAFSADEESFFASPIDHLVGDDFFE
jgi:hypothetical protein